MLNINPHWENRAISSRSDRSPLPKLHVRKSASPSNQSTIRSAKISCFSDSKQRHSPRPPNKPKPQKLSNKYSFERLTPFRTPLPKEDITNDILEMCNHNEAILKPNLIQYSPRRTIASYIPPQIKPYSVIRGIVKLTKEDCGSIYDELSLKALELELQDQLIKYYPLLCPAPKETFESLVLQYAFFFKESRHLCKDLYEPNKYLLSLSFTIFELLLPRMEPYSEILYTLLCEIGRSCYVNYDGNLTSNNQPLRYFDGYPYVIRYRESESENHLIAADRDRCRNLFLKHLNTLKDEGGGDNIQVRQAHKKIMRQAFNEWKGIIQHNKQLKNHLQILFSRQFRDPKQIILRVFKAWKEIIITKKSKASQYNYEALVKYKDDTINNIELTKSKLVELKEDLEDYLKQKQLIDYEYERVSSKIDIRPNQFYCDDKSIYGVTGGFLYSLRKTRHALISVTPILSRHYGNINPIKPSNYPNSDYYNMNELLCNWYKYLTGGELNDLSELSDERDYLKLLASVLMHTESVDTSDGYQYLLNKTLVHEKRTDSVWEDVSNSNIAFNYTLLSSLFLSKPYLPSSLAPYRTVQSHFKQLQKVDKVTTYSDENLSKEHNETSQALNQTIPYISSMMDLIQNNVNDSNRISECLFAECWRKSIEVSKKCPFSSDILNEFDASLYGLDIPKSILCERTFTVLNLFTSFLRDSSLCINEYWYIIKHLRLITKVSEAALFELLLYHLGINKKECRETKSHEFDVIEPTKLLLLFLKTLEMIEPNISVGTLFSQEMKESIIPFTSKQSLSLQDKHNPKYYCKEIQNKYHDSLLHLWNDYSVYRKEIDVRVLDKEYWEKLGNDNHLINDSYKIEEHNHIWLEVQHTLPMKGEITLSMLYPEFVESIIVLALHQIRDPFRSVVDITGVFLSSLLSSNTTSFIKKRSISPRESYIIEDAVVEEGSTISIKSLDESDGRRESKMMVHNESQLIQPDF